MSNLNSNARRGLLLGLVALGGSALALSVWFLRKTSDADPVERTAMEADSHAAPLKTVHSVESTVDRAARAVLSTAEVESAFLTVVVDGLSPSRDGERRVVHAWVYVEESSRSGHFVPYESQPLPDTPSEARLEFTVPADRRLFAALSGGGVRHSTRGDEIVVAAGERRELRIDLAITASMLVQLEQLPTSMLAGRNIELTFLFEPEGQRSPWGSLQQRFEVAVTDAQGLARFSGLKPGPVRLGLREGERVHDLIDVLDGRSSWEIERTPNVRVRAADALVLIFPVDERGTHLVDEPFAIVPASSPPVEPRLHAAGGAMVPRSWLDDPAGIRFLSSVRGVRLASREDLLEVAPQTIQLRVDDGESSCAVRVLVPESMSLDLRLDVQRDIEGEYHDLLPYQRPRLHEPSPATSSDPFRAGYAVERDAEGFRAWGLPPGRYRLGWSWRAEASRPFAEVELQSGRTAIVRAEAVEVRRVPGRVEAWDGLAPELRPRTLALDGVQAELLDGRFECDVLFPLDTQVEILGPGMLMRHVADAVTWDTEADEIVVRIRSDDLVQHRVEIIPILGGRIVAEVHRLHPLHRLTPYFVQPQEQHRLFLPLPRVETASVLLIEYHSSGRALRGWVHLGEQPMNVELPAPGRWVDLTFDDPGRLVRLELSTDRGPVFDLGYFDTGQPARVWLPEAVDVLRVVEGGATSPIEIAVPGGAVDVHIPMRTSR